MTDKVHIVVGSHNPVKINAARAAVATLHPEASIEVEAVSAPSGVADQPMTDAETKLGAINRVEWCREHYQADYYLSMEGGVDLFEQGPATFAYVTIATDTQLCVGRTAHLPLPQQVFDKLGEQELGDIMDALFNTVNVKQAGGAIGLLTNGNANRESIYTAALVLATAPLRYAELY
ncbi:xanthosine triphosphate pyrophosphatase [Shewanella mangrovi]|uniref:inosine/xanthosine triphosphatase n=1 Tax=Shewanella mangrovi TaxID=1515746 RepID=A0A094JYD5_9GAMM|nr:inosine/xanthosine triphosphatase [Shewanella mangrovi]KFZ37411.1 xanthosine triphosphate pyrophosphatase [Shewanella mangrovi]